MRTELQFTYDDNMHPTAAHCTRCGRAMRMPDAQMRDTAQIIMVISEQFLRHKRIEHPPIPEDIDQEAYSYNPTR